MASSPGRTSEPRTVAGVGTTSSSSAITFTSGTIQSSDVGRTVTGTGIPAGATLATRSSATAGTLSANATATGTVSVVLGGPPASSASLGFTGWSPETDAEAAVYPIAAGAGAGAPSVVSDSITRVTQRNR
jgi:hypothetical protein